MICRIVRGLGPLHAGRDLPGVLLARLDGHIGRCADCRAALDLHEQGRDRLRQARDAMEAQEPGGDMGEERFWYAVRRELRSEGLCGPGAAERRRARPAPVERVPAGMAWRAAAAVVVVLGAWFFVNPPGQEPGGTDNGAVVVREGGDAGATAARLSGAGATGAAASQEGALQGEPGGWVEPVEPAGPPAIEYQLEGWQAPSAERSVHEF